MSYNGMTTSDIYRIVAHGLRRAGHPEELKAANDFENKAAVMEAHEILKGQEKNEKV